MLKQTSLYLCLHGLEYSHRLNCNEKQNRFLSLLQEGDEAEGAHSGILLMQHLKKMESRFCRADLCRERHRKARLVGSSSFERVPVHGKKAVHWEKERAVRRCVLGVTAEARAKSRLPGGVARHHPRPGRRARKPAVHLRLFSLAVPAFNWTNSPGEPTGVFLWEAEGL